MNQFTSDGGDESTEPIATFDSVAVLAPRGRFTIELFNSFLKLGGPVRPGRRPPRGTTPPRTCFTARSSSLIVSS